MLLLEQTNSPQSVIKESKVYSLSVVLTFSLAGLLAGILMGIYFTQRKSDYGQRQTELEKHISEMQNQQQRYQSEVSTHFNQTAQLLNQLTDSYRDVHSHLTEGAQLLADANTGASIKTLGSDDSEAVIEQTDPTPPLDYAATNRGVLSEEWGIEKPSAVAERNDSGYPNSPA